MGKKCGIYCIENTITHKRYIGLSCDIDQRWCVHRWELNQNVHVNSYLQRAWNKYGPEAFEFAILEECERSQLADREIFYIAKYNSNDGRCGYNLTEGGETPLGRPVIDYHTGYVYPSIVHACNELHKTEPTIRIWCQNRHNYMFHDEWEKLSDSEKEVVKSVDWVAIDHAKLSEAHKAYNLSAETRAKQSRANRGGKNAMAIMVYCPELDEFFECINDACRKYGVCASSISHCLSGKLKHAGKHPVTGKKLSWVKV